MRYRVLIDTGPLVAILSERDQFHEICTEQLRQLSPPLLTCWPVITEAAWLLRTDLQSISRLVESFEVGLYRLAPMDEASLPWISGFLRKYRKLGAQLADASLAYLAEREQIDTVFTLDRRDFGVYRRKGNKPFTLIPQLP